MMRRPDPPSRNIRMQVKVPYLILLITTCIAVGMVLIGSQISGKTGHILVYTAPAIVVIVAFVILLWLDFIMRE